MNSALKISWLFLLFVRFHLAGTTGLAQPMATIDTSRIVIGQQFHLDLSIEVNVQNSIVFPVIGDTIISQIEVIHRSAVDTSFNPNDITQKTLHQRLTLTSFDSGFFAIPPFRFIVNSDTLETGPILIEVHTIQVDSSQLADIKAPLEVEYTFIDWLKDNWHWVAGGLALIGTIVLLFYYFSKRKTKPVMIFEKPRPVLPAHVIALQKLDHLKEKKLWQNDKVKQFHTEISEIIREYLENRFHISALEQTTFEILQALRSVQIDTNERERLQKLLFLSDLVKFAKEWPLATENEMCLNDAYGFVERTKMSISQPSSAEPEKEIKMVDPNNH